MDVGEADEALIRRYELQNELVVLDELLVRRKLGSPIQFANVVGMGQESAPTSGKQDPGKIAIQQGVVE